MGNPKKTPFDTPEFLALRKEWYKKLKDSGFKDIEHTDWETGESGNLMNGFSLMDAYRQYTPEQDRYFQLAVQYRRNVYQRKYMGYLEDWHVKAWTLHSNGKSYRQIQEELGVHRRHVSKYIQEEAKRMLKWARKDSTDVG